MDLSKDLISQFVKITNDGDKNKAKETTVYGTAVEYEGEMYVRIDGSELITPVETTANIQVGERVTVMIKNHTATVTGNITAPSTNDSAVDKVVTEKVGGVNNTVESLGSEVTGISTLVGGNLTADNIASFNITADKMTMEDSFIKNSMIDGISGEKIKSGVINTDKVSIQNIEGSLMIDGSMIQFTDADGNVRLQIGKEAKGDFIFVLYGANGQNQLINQNGLTSSAIGDGLITNRMIGNDAAISSTKIYLEEQAQALEAAFNSLKARVDELQQRIDGL